MKLDKRSQNRISKIFEDFALKDILNIYLDKYSEGDLLCTLEELDVDLLPSDIRDELEFFRKQEKNLDHFEEGKRFKEILEDKKLSIEKHSKILEFLEEMKP